MRIDDVLKGHGVGVGGGYEETKDFIIGPISESPIFDANIRTLTNDDKYIYSSGTNRKIRKINPTNMSVVATSAAASGANNSKIVYVDGYIYECGSNGVMRKVSPTDLSVIMSSAYISGSVRGVDSDGKYLYVCLTTGYVQKRSLADLSVVAESPGYTDRTYSSLIIANGYIYCGESENQRVYKFNSSNMQQVEMSPPFYADIQALAYDGEHIYCGGHSNNVAKIRKINPVNLSVAVESASFPGSIYALAYDGEYIYSCGYGGAVNASRVLKLDPSSMSLVSDSSTYGTSIDALINYGKYIYCGGDLKKVGKMTPTIYLKK